MYQMGKFNTSDCWKVCLRSLFISYRGQTNVELSYVKSKENEYEHS